MAPISDNNVKIIPFCIPLPSASSLIASAVGEEEDTNDNATSSYGIVGTITLRGKSAVVWFGWGDIEPGNSIDVVTEKDGVFSVGNGTYISSLVHKICTLMYMFILSLLLSIATLISFIIGLIYIYIQ